MTSLFKACKLHGRWFHPKHSECRWNRGKRCCHWYIPRVRTSTVFSAAHLLAVEPECLRASTAGGHHPSLRIGKRTLEGRCKLTPSGGAYAVRNRPDILEMISPNLAPSIPRRHNMPPRQSCGRAVSCSNLKTGTREECINQSMLRLS